MTSLPSGMDRERVDPLLLELQSAVVGRYSLEREIGRGGMGVVFLARDVTLDRPVAIKLLPPHLAAIPGIRERFLREARTAARLSHPNIVPIHAVEEAGRLVFFVMTYVPGETLAARLESGGPVPPREAGRILREVAWALSYAHQQGVVHRDVKPDNILLEAATGRALVSDFGIAARVGGEEPGEVAGTVAYMSPEQARGDPVDGRSDLYSLGVVGYRALSGRLPDPVTTLEELVARQLTGPAAGLGGAAPHVPRSLCRAVDRCLERDPAARFPAAGELAGALDQLAAPPAELPAPLRVWLTGDDRTRGLAVIWSGVWAFPVAGVVIGSLVYGFPAFAPLPLLFAVALWPWPLFGGARLIRTRRVLAAGYTRNDIVLALRNQAERRHEELVFEIGNPPSRLGRWLRRATFVSFGLTVATAAFQWAIPVAIFAPLWTGLAAGTLLGAIVGTAVPGRVIPIRDKPGWREKLWAGPVGRILARLAGWRLGRRGAPEHTLHRPTEIALGEAAEALFAALPAEHRRDLAELPRTIAALSGQASELRRQVAELDELIARGSPTPAGAGPLGEARSALLDQLKDAVTLLESLRVGLLRLHAGAGTPAAITADLTLAREFRARLGALAEAHAELRGLLGERPTAGSIDREITPDPA